ncbi:MAG: hypothetical protein EZS28_012682 [Streblomastix strix]|uniref:Uncharacterized protein n=1 Tax=Streblomastix strix TaxID=222440 RepID=A0A5J4WAV7_9EUKA|nr:MAG: hypothetical protein EZS28_012682 [Streblomastix strix]
MRIKRGTIPSFQEFEEMRRKLAEQSSYLKGYSDKGRQQRMKSGYKVLGIAVDDAEKNSVPVAPQMLPRNHPFMLHGPPRKWYQKQINKMIYSKSQIADILATRELKSIFDTVWFQEYTEEFKKRNNRNIAKLTWPQIYEAQTPDHIIELPELTKEQKKSTLRFGYVDSDSDYADDSDDDEDDSDDDDDEESEFNIEDVMGSNLFDFKVKRKKKKEKEKEANIEISQLQKTPSVSSQTSAVKLNQQKQQQQQSSQTNPNQNSSEQQPNKRLTPVVLNQEAQSEQFGNQTESIIQFSHTDLPQSIIQTSPPIKDIQE